MRSLSTRLAALECATPLGVERWHRVIQRVGQSRDEALDQYGRDKIGDRDGVIVRQIARPATRKEG